MEIARGIVSNCQHTLKISGGSNQTASSTTYIALFRVNGQPVEYRTSAPSSISDGDQIVAAGPMYRGAINALACRNVTTGEVTNSGLWGYVIGAVLVPCIGIFFCVKIAGNLGTVWPLALGVLFTVAITAYLGYQVVLTQRAMAAVGA